MPQNHDSKQKTRARGSDGKINENTRKYDFFNASSYWPRFSALRPEAGSKTRDLGPPVAEIFVRNLGTAFEGDFRGSSPPALVILLKGERRPRIGSGRLSEKWLNGESSAPSVGRYGAKCIPKSRVHNKHKVREDVPAVDKAVNSNSTSDNLGAVGFFRSVIEQS
ncbi:hypothetical protein K474DRAFT_1678959 [Panus rudis PR-1116 ss-1]|nr:hypothetical protein K474DRAFT_1678959 [Panus rudis PR-1116 ss-1]